LFEKKDLAILIVGDNRPGEYNFTNCNQRKAVHKMLMKLATGLIK
jgi:hypothetical protein